MFTLFCSTSLLAQCEVGFRWQPYSFQIASQETCYIKFQFSRLICSRTKQWDHLHKPSLILLVTHYLSAICKSHFGFKGAKLLPGEAFPQREESSGETLWLYPSQWFCETIQRSLERWIQQIMVIRKRRRILKWLGAKISCFCFLCLCSSPGVPDARCNTLLL